MLIPLAFTSFNIWKTRLKKNWKRIHQTIYIIAPLAILHYAWGKKGDFFALRGDIIRPLIYGIIVMILLIFRIPLARRALASLRDRTLVLLSRYRIQPEA
jgi:sulfoxide reductase heme-binding subunit YedZ